MAGQIVMEGFLRFRMQPWLRRAVTRTLAIIPAVLTIYLFGAGSTLQLIIFSQAVLTMQLPFAVIPLVHLTSDQRIMGSFANGLWLKAGRLELRDIHTGAGCLDDGGAGGGMDAGGTGRFTAR